MSNLHEKAIAASERFLERRGYEVLSTSWEAPDGFGTIDVVAMDEDTIVFVTVEAKTPPTASPRRTTTASSARPSQPSGSRRTPSAVTSRSDSTQSR